MSIDAKRSRRLRRLSSVPRWVVIPTIHHQNVAEHSFHVAHIALWVVQQLKWAVAVDVADILYYALIHDEMEAITGDTPSPANAEHMPNKATYENEHLMGKAPATPGIKRLLKLADLLEAWLFVLEEKQMGNTGLQMVEESIIMRIKCELCRIDADAPSLNVNWILFLKRFKEDFNPAIHSADEI